MIRRNKLLFVVIGCFCVFGLCGCLKRDVKEAISIKQQKEFYKQLNESVGFTDDFFKNEVIDEETKEQIRQDELISGEMHFPDGIDIDFDELKKINDDVYAWMYIPETKISYPILQSSSEKPDDYYLKHNIDCSEGYPGCVYSQKRNSKDFTDPDTVLYGHNMSDGTMFAALHNYKDEDYFKKHDELYIYLSDRLLKYKIFAAFPEDDKLILDYYEDFSDPYVFQDYVTQIGLIKDKSNSQVNEEIALNTDLKLLTLSTCEKDNTKRYIVVYVLSDTKIY